MTVTVVTPTYKRPAALKLTERWLRQQTRRPDEWLVIDGARRPYGLTNLMDSLAAGCAKARGKVIIVCEDDDYYAPTHLETMVAGFDAPDVMLVGDSLLRGYDLRDRTWRVYQNEGMATLCETALRRELVPQLCEVLRTHPKQGVDLLLWGSVPPERTRFVSTHTVVAMRWWGSGLGSWPMLKGTPDVAGTVLREWCGDDAAQYLEAA